MLTVTSSTKGKGSRAEQVQFKTVPELISNEKKDYHLILGMKGLKRNTIQEMHSLCSKPQ